MNTTRPHGRKACVCVRLRPPSRGPATPLARPHRCHVVMGHTNGRFARRSTPGGSRLRLGVAFSRADSIALAGVRRSPPQHLLCPTAIPARLLCATTYPSAPLYTETERFSHTRSLCTHNARTATATPPRPPQARRWCMRSAASCAFAHRRAAAQMFGRRVAQRHCAGHRRTPTWRVDARTTLRPRKKRL